MNKYNLPMRLMHWISGGLFLLTLFFGIILANTELLKGPDEIKYILLHKSFGVLVFFLVLSRLIIRGFSSIPRGPKSSSKLEVFVEKIVHFALYCVLLAIPFSGYSMSCFGGKTVSFFGLFNLPCLFDKNQQLSGLFYQSHKIIAITAFCLVGLHILASLKHLIFNKENLFKRII